MFKCNRCGVQFEEPITQRTNYSTQYGVPYEAGGYIELFLKLCPICGSEEIEEHLEEMEE